MKIEILRCPSCRSYTINDQCPSCQTKTLSPKPAKYSPEDKYGKYRRMAKKSLSTRPPQTQFAQSQV